MTRERAMVSSPFSTASASAVKRETKAAAPVRWTWPTSWRSRDSNILSRSRAAAAWAVTPTRVS